MTWYFFKAIIAVATLHEKKIYYGDVKSANFLVFEDGEVCIGDFGTAIIIKQPDENLYKIEAGTPAMMMAEVKELIANEAPNSIWLRMRTGVVCRVFMSSVGRGSCVL